MTTAELAEARALERAAQDRACLQPTTRAELLELVEAWRATNWIAIHREPWKGQPLCFYLYDLNVAREHYRRGGWADAHFKRQPELETAARLFRRAELAAGQVRELLELVEPGASWEPEGPAEAWAALHRIAREARPGLPSLGKLA